MMRDEILVIGCGVIGLPTAFMFARSGLSTLGIDKDAEKMALLQSKMWPLPKDLSQYQDLVGIRLRFDTACTMGPECIVVCVGVGIDENHNPIFTEFDELVTDIGKLLRRGVMVCFETTLPPGTMTYKVKPLLEQVSGLECGKDFFLVYAPERVTLERLVFNMENMPRVVGGYTKECQEKGAEIYGRICKTIKLTDLTTAEITKLTENTYRDVNIAFANEVAAICDACDVDFREVRGLVNSLPNIPDNEFINPVRNLHFAGVGVGGYCLPKDPHLLRSIKPHGLENSVIEKSRELNDEVPKYIATKAIRTIINSGWAQDGTGYDVLVLGYSAIRNTGDCRKSPAIPLVGKLAESGFIRNIRIFDPYVDEYTPIISEREKTAAIIILVTAHDVFDKMFKPELMEKLKSERVILNDKEYF